MKLRATRTFLNDVGMVRRGAEVEIQDVQAKFLISRKLAVPVDDEPKPKPPEKPKGKKPVNGAAAPQGE